MRHHVFSEIEIEASAAEVWAVLTDYDHVGEWNEMVLELREVGAVGDRLRSSIRIGDRAPMAITPRLLALDRERELRWKGKLGVPGIFDGEHRFAIEPCGEHRVRFVHEEFFSGVLVRPLVAMMGPALPAAFEGFNRALRDEVLRRAGAPDAGVDHP